MDVSLPSSSRVRNWVRPQAHPGQPLVRRAPGFGRFQARLHSMGIQVVIQTHGHGLTQGPQVQGIGVVAEDSLDGSGGLAVLTLADLGLAFLGGAMEDDGGSAYQVIFEELVQVWGVKTGEV